MKTWLVITTACLAVGAEATILVPDEVPTLTAIIYSLLPPVKLGQDSRFGFGFRIGRNVDAQFLIELGPQQATEPLGNDSGKREVSSIVRSISTPAERERLLRTLFMDKIRNSENNALTSNFSTSMNITTIDDKQTQPT